MKKKIWLGLAAGIGICVLCILIWHYKVSEDTKGSVWANTSGNVLEDRDNRSGSGPGKRVDVVHPWPVEDGLLITLPGRARASRQATLFFRVSGPLHQVRVKPGDKVKKGDLMLRLDDRDYLRRVRAVQSRLKSARANLLKMENGARAEDIRIIEASLEAARADLDLAEKELKRYETLYRNAAVSEQNLDRARNNVKLLQAKTVSLEQQLARDRTGARKEDLLAARAGIEELEVELDIARDQLNDTRLVAPFDGVVTRLIPDAFEMVTQGQPVLTLDNIATLEIPVDVPENQIHLFLEKEKPRTYKARFLTTGPRPFEAKLAEYAARADQTTGTYEFVFSVTPDSQGVIFPGMTSEISVYGAAGDEKKEKLVIPLLSLTGVSGNSAQVFLVDRETRTAQKRGIVFQGLDDSENVVVLEGLAPEDLIVTGGSSFIRPGQALEFKLPN
ncbi:efflux RND transporter periplasmic adaptor subunit [Desulfospira joergensenii]|uniref:efflux RND transporter periplasmic adaptor subunit n=1 Tax=Desulfospira joergensenii TaxID=53329 RepID=UPI0004120534|nr:efflux RND transporter periplasmic adaptor subunit [Desulfospira joergensenii]